MRPVVGQRVNKRQNLIAGVNAHVHVHTVNDHVAAPILGAFDHTLIAFLRHNRLVSPVGEGERAGGVELNTQLIGDVAQSIRQILQLAARLSDGAADAGHHLDGVSPGIRRSRAPGREAAQAVRGRRSRRMDSTSLARWVSAPLPRSMSAISHSTPRVDCGEVAKSIIVPSRVWK